MEPNEDKYFERLIEILNRKKPLMQELLVLTQAQTGLITEDTLEKLQKLTDDKQKRIDAVNKLDEEFSVYFQRLKSIMNISSLDQLDVSGHTGAKRLKAITSEIIDIVKKTMEVEKKNSDKSRELKSELGQQIKKISQAKKVNSAYSPMQINQPSYFIDKKK